MKHLSRNQAEQLSKRISQREKEFRERVAQERDRANTEGYSELTGLVGDAADRAFAGIRAGIESELLDSHLNELKAIEFARTRVTEGTFGSYVDCGDAIDYERLRVYPTACRCAPCQASHEKKTPPTLP